jgi:hypothetical protein
MVELWDDRSRAGGAEDRAASGQADDEAAGMKCALADLPATHQPINRQAGLAVARAGKHYDWKPAAHNVHQDTRLPTRPVDSSMRGAPSFVDLTDRTIGRVRVIGVSMVLKRSVVRLPVRHLRDPHCQGAQGWHGLFCPACERTDVPRKRAAHA